MTNYSIEGKQEREGYEEEGREEKKQRKGEKEWREVGVR